MKLVELIAECKRLGIDLSVENQKLKVVKRTGPIPAELINNLKNHKAALLSYLEAHMLYEDNIVPILGVSEIPASPTQRRLWLMDQMQGGSHEYNSAHVFNWAGNFNHSAAELALGAIVARHQSLRTTFFDHEHQLYQQVQPVTDFIIEHVDLTEMPSDQQQERAAQLGELEARQRFELSHDLMLRATSVTLQRNTYGQGKGLFLMTLHHIACDGWSMDILLREFKQLYKKFSSNSDANLAPLSIQYSDYAVWLDKCNNDSFKLVQYDYWLAMMANAPKTHKLPLDYPRPAVKNSVGERLKLTLSSRTAKRLLTIAQHLNMTPFMLTHAALALVVAKRGGDPDTVIGTATASRDKAELAPLIGFFANTLVLRSHAEHSSLQAYLSHIATINIDALQHQQIEIDELIEQLQIRRSSQYTPLFQIMLATNMHFDFAKDNNTKIDFGDVTFQPQVQQNIAVKFDLDVIVNFATDGIELNWLYDTKLFSKDNIALCMHHMGEVLNRIADSEALILAGQHVDLREISDVTDNEKHLLLQSLNKSGQAVKADLCIHNLFEQRVQQQPDSVAIKYGLQTMSYEALDRAANQMAHYLIALGVRPGELLGICQKRGPKMIIAVLAVLKAGAAYLPLDPDYPAERLNYMVADAKLTRILGQNGMPEKFTQTAIEWVLVDNTAIEIAINHCEISTPEQPLLAVNSESLAYVVYTSGSTGAPKGSMIRHGSLVNLGKTQGLSLNVTAQSCILQFASFAFDAATWDWVMALTNGASLLLITQQQMTSPQQLAQQVIEHKVTHATLPPALLPALTIADWRGVSTLIIAGEACGLELARLWSQGRTLINAYGPSEATICATWGEVLVTDSELSIGQPIDNVQCYILDPHQKLVPFGAIGELYIGGVGVSIGYLNKAKLTAEKFIENPFYQANIGQSKSLYRSGDLVRYAHNQRMIFVGRNDEQVKIRGFRVELGEITHQIQGCNGVDSALVIATSGSDGVKELLTYMQPNEDITGKEQEFVAAIKQALCQVLPDYMVPRRYVLIAQWPLTANGKIDKKALPEKEFRAAESAYHAAETATEHQIALMCSSLLNMPFEKMSLADNFFELGGHSLLLMRLANTIAAEFNVDIEISTLLNASSLQHIALEIDLLLKNDHKQRQKIQSTSDTSQALPMSFSQQRLWFIDQMEQGSAHYNMPVAFDVIGQFDLAAASASLTALVARHEVLRTVYITVEQQGCQRIQPATPVNIAYESLCDLSLDEQGAALEQRIITQASQLFDLSRDLMIRAHFIKLSDHHGTLLFNMHHIASDGWSMGILVKEFIALYRHFAMAEELTLAPLAIQYADYAVWQRNHAAQGHLDAQLDYWTTQLADAPSVHSLPLDKPRPAVKQYQGNVVHGHLDEGVVARLQKTAQDHSMTAFMVLHGALSLVLSRHSYSEDVLIGTPVANRQREELAPLIGFFVNTLVLRVHTGHDKVSDYLAHVKAVHLAGQANQDIPFDQLVDHCQVARSTGHSPLFQIMLTLEQDESYELVLPQVAIRPRSSKQAVAKFDLTINVKLESNGAQIEWLYDKALFSEAHISQLNAHFEGLLAELVSGQAARVNELEMLSAAEQTYLTESLNPQEQRYPSACIHTLFEEQVAQGSTRIALEYQAEQITYGELNARASHVAAVLLNGYQVTPGSLIGICMGRTPDMIVAMLGILKAGCAYVPLDPNYPKARLEEISQSAELKLVLIDQELDVNMPSMLFSELQLLSAGRDHSKTTISVSPESLAYVIFTSGSTGKPKGVMIHHRNAVAMLNWARTVYQDEELSRVLFSTSINFDLSIFELFLPLSFGFTSILVENALSLCEGNPKPSLINTVPSAIRGLLNQNKIPDSVKVVNLAGEPLAAKVVNELLALQSVTRVCNLYGPSEDTTYSTFANFVEPLQCSPSIGRVITNSQGYVLDRQLNLVPFGCSGELFLAGAGVSSGYYGQAEMTKERFINNPFGAGTLYRTGDWVRYRESGELEYLGRLDNQVKVRGFRIELNEIEHQLNQLPEVAESQVLVVPSANGGNQLIAFLIAETGVDSQNPELAKQLKEKLYKLLPEYMVPARLTVLENWLLLPNGKIDKKSLAKLSLPQELTDSRAFNALELQLAEVWSELLNRSIAQLTPDANFFELGGDSILSIQLVSRAASKGLFFTVKDIFSAQTIAKLTRETKLQQEGYFEQSASQGEQDLLPIQKAFFADIEQKNHYNQAIILKVPGSIEKEELQQFVATLCERHDVLRLAFNVKDETWQANYRALSSIDIEQMIHVIPWDGVNSDDISQHAIHYQASLNIEEGPLMRWLYFKPESAEHDARLLIISHHLLIDGVSWRILLADLERLYLQSERKEALELASKTTSYQDWGRYLSEFSQTTTLNKEQDYWLDKGRAKSHILALQATKARSIESVKFSLPKTLTSQLLTQCHQAYRMKINELLLSALYLAIQRTTGEAAFRIDLEGHGRETLDSAISLDDTIGWFTSLYPVVLSSVNPANIADTLCSIKDDYRNIPNQGLGFGVLKYLNEQSEIAEVSGSQILFNYLGQVDQTVNAERCFDIASESYGDSISEVNLPVHDLSIAGIVAEGTMSFTWSYLAPRLNRQQVNVLADAFISAVEVIVLHCIERQEVRLTPSDFTLAKIEQAQLDEWQKHYDIADLYPATGMQQGMLFHTLMDHSSYISQLMFTFKGLELDRFVSAWQLMISKYDILRTSFVGLEQGNPQQLISSNAKLDWQEHDLRDLTVEQQLQRIDALRIADKKRGFSLEQAPLMRMSFCLLAAGHYRVVWSFHHALLDGWSIPILFQDLLHLYSADASTGYEPLPESSRYRNYVAWLEQQDEELAKDYWQQQLTQLSHKTPLPLQEYRAHSDTVENHVESFSLSTQETNQLRQLAGESTTTLSLVVHAAWALLLSRYSGEKKVMFGATTSGRPAELKDVERIAGLFINTLPVVVDLDTELDITGFLKSLASQQLEREQFNYLPLQKIKQLAATELDNSLFDSVIVFENFPVNENLTKQAQGASLSISDVEAVEGSTYGIGITATARECLSLKLEVQGNLMSRHSASCLAQSFQYLLSNLTQGQHLPIVQLSLQAGGSELLSIDDGILGPVTDYPREQCLHQLFSQQVAKTPDATAIVYYDNDLTYRELEHRSDQLAVSIQQLIGGGSSLKEMPVVLYFERSVDMVVAILATLKAGGTFVPVAPDCPVSRMAHIVRETGARLILSHRPLSLQVQQYKAQHFSDVHVLLADEPQKISAQLAVTSGGENLAYIIYTSGTTGTPKGVMVEHGGFANLVNALSRQLVIKPNEATLWLTSYVFDASLEALFLMLLNGGKVVIPSQQDINLPHAIFEQMELHAISHLVATPSYLLALGLPPCHDNINRVVYGGESASKALVDLWGNKLINEYGPTEATVTTTLCTDIAEQQTLNCIGEPIDNMACFILDNLGRPALPGAIGHLHISGVGLARGYINQPALTDAAFVELPFQFDNGDVGSKRFYKTGDFVKHIANQGLIFIGRHDQQVKVRGYRIELVEVENHLLANDLVTLAVVDVRCDNNGVAKLVAYVEFNKQRFETEVETSQQLKSQLADSLPDYMIPTSIIKVTSWPKLPSGKIDKKALPEPELNTQISMFKAATDTEQALVKLISELLKVDIDKISMAANLFEIGGHSLFVIRLVAEVRTQFDVELDVRAVYEAKELRAISSEIDAAVALNFAQQQHKNAVIKKKGTL